MLQRQIYLDATVPVSYTHLCFDKFGGHPMAAGFSMQEDRLEEFREKLNANATLTAVSYTHLVRTE